MGDVVAESLSASRGEATGEVVTSTTNGTADVVADTLTASGGEGTRGVVSRATDLPAVVVVDARDVAPSAVAVAISRPAVPALPTPASPSRVSQGTPPKAPVRPSRPDAGNAGASTLPRAAAAHAEAPSSTAVPTAAPTATVSPTVSPTPTPTVSPPSTPTLSSTPTVSPTLSVMPTLSSTATVSPTVAPPTTVSPTLLVAAPVDARRLPLPTANRRPSGAPSTRVAGRAAEALSTPVVASPGMSSTPPVPTGAPALRAPAREASTDLRVQARPSEKAPPATRFEVVEKGIGASPAADKGDSKASKAPQAHAAAVAPATLVAPAPVDGTIQPRHAAPRHAAPERTVAAAAHPGIQAGAHRPGAAATHLFAQGRELLAGLPRAPGGAAMSAGGERSPAPAPASHAHAPTTAPVPFDALLASLPHSMPTSLPQQAPLPAAPGPLLAQAAEDLSLRATVMPERAVLSIDAGTAGELALHLRVRDGIADVRVTGAAAAEMRPAELRAALASEGLTLGSFESGQSPPITPRAADIPTPPTMPPPSRESRRAPPRP